MTNFRDLDVLDAAEQVADEINGIIDRDPRRILHRGQLLDSSQSIPSNIAEGFGRRTRAQRNESLSTARGSCEETVRHLRPNYHSARIDRATYWRLHNRLITISKMISSLMNT